MEPSTLYTDPKARPKPSKIWVLLTLLVGAAGALAAVGVAGKGTYEIRPFIVELSARPAPAGKTEITVRPADPDLAKLTPNGHAEAGTHAGPLVARATIVDIAPGARLAPSDIELFTDPREVTAFLSSDGREALQAFVIKLAIVALLGGAAAGAAIGVRRPRRIVGAALGGLLTFAVIGLMVQQTYDSNEFAKTRYVFERPTGPTSQVDPA